MIEENIYNPLDAPLPNIYDHEQNAIDISIGNTQCKMQDTTILFNVDMVYILRTQEVTEN